jgi:DNA-directed RNA polymerase specialized sigma24 family protein
MSKPDPITDEQLKIINRVINRQALKYVFHGYTLEDIRQEAFIICHEALSRHDGVRPLENFLSVHLSNRLKNFVRDNNPDMEGRKGKVVTPAQLTDDLNIIGETRDMVSMTTNSEMATLIDTKLGPKWRADYLKIINDVYVPRKQRQDVLDQIERILVEGGYA